MSLKKFAPVLLAILAIFMAGCASDEGTAAATYRHINAEEAKHLMDTEEDYIILDVRRQDEYDMGHIPDAVLLPHEEIGEKAGEMLPDKEQMILVYCRSGNRSRIAAESLAGLGYTNIVEFGGIMDWPYEVVQ